MNRLLCTFGLVSLIGASLWAQQTCTIVGRVTDPALKPLTGALISVESPALMGVRWVNSDSQGRFVVRSILPGSYLLTLSMDGYNTSKVRLEMGLNTTARPVIRLKPISIIEHMTVTELIDPIHDTATMMQHFDNNFLEFMPVLRPDPRSVANLSMGVSQAGPKRQLQISGAPSYENLYLLDGGNHSRDNINGQSSDLTLRDSIQEVSVLSGSISAEFGNFAGGVVNALSLAGGNQFEGLVRASFFSEKWRALTPFEREAFGSAGDTRNDKLLGSYSFRLGGPIMKDRLWYFFAGQSFHEDREGFLNTGLSLSSAESAALGVTDHGPGDRDRSFARTIEDDRFEVKLSAAPTNNQLLVLSYTQRDYNLINNPVSGVLTTRSLIPKSEEPESLASLHYQLSMSQHLTLELNYTEKKLSFTDTIDQAAGTDSTVIVDTRSLFHLGAPLASHLISEHRDNHNFKVKLAYLFNTEGGSQHDLAFGFEDHRDSNINNSPSRPNGWQIAAYSYYDANHQIQPVFGTALGLGLRTSLTYRFIDTPSLGNSFRTSSLFFNDEWTFDSQWKANLGLRLDENNATGSDGLAISTKASFSPRLWLEFNPWGDGLHRFRAGYSRYTSRIANTAAGAASAGRESAAIWDYLGPATTSTADVFSWFQNTYGDPRSLTALQSAIVAQLVDPANPQLVVDPDLGSPYANEFHFNYNLAHEKRWLVNLGLLERSFHDYYIEKRDLSTGRTPNGLFDQGILTNDDGNYERKYRALQSLFQYKPTDSLLFGGNYTWSKIRGNLQGDSNFGAIRTTSLTSYPEYNSFPGRAPIVNLQGDRRHLGRIWMSYSHSFGFLKGNLSLLQEWASGTEFQVAIPINITSAYGFPANPGYATPPRTTVYILPPSDHSKTPGYTRTDLALNLDFSMKSGTFFTRFKLINLFNNQKQTYPLFSSFPIRTLAPFNVFTEKPVEGVHYEFRPEFGTAQNRESYQDPREAVFELGYKF